MRRMLQASSASSAKCDVVLNGSRVMSVVPSAERWFGTGETLKRPYQFSYDAQELKYKHRSADATGFFLGGHATVRHLARLASRDDLKVTKLLRMNDNITAPLVRFVDPDGNNEIVKVQVALAKAVEANLDLVEVSPNADPPVVRLMDYSKHRFEKKRRESQKKADQKRSGVLKEVRFTSRISENDLLTKVSTIEKFLAKGYKVQVVVMGKMSAGQEEGVLLLQHTVQLVAHLCKVDKEPGKDKSGRVTVMLQGIPNTKEGGDNNPDDEDD
eukprot:CAMPEP_0118937446 /NCGR_PEP_ID=MMETSP1169-20130426/22802_1 /TAXON_ID=36882 /ORGANISM="Pyramimonas obovata, Strain CCMP722" /LENGTH=270 /DNA_ID=CAMNT_0006881081 /DNA_START=246 /DNA_END=1058 /DNA_ORIENTATION=-